MEAFLLENETIVRLFFFAMSIGAIGLLEYRYPRRKLILKKLKRWANNFLLVFIYSVIVRILFPIAAFGVALYAEQNQLGLLYLVEFPYLVEFFLCLIVLDLMIYWQHRIFHQVNFFWKFHKVHHSDLDYDLTTGLRFHPFEIIFSMLIKIVAVLLLGIPVLAVLVFEVLLNTFAMFTHSNIHLPKKLDKYMRIFIVTPDFHRVHHSIDQGEYNNNYGFNIALWDRIFKSYIPFPKKPHQEMEIGLEEYREEEQVLPFFRLLKMPFLKN